MPDIPANTPRILCDLPRLREKAVARKAHAAGYNLAVSRLLKAGFIIESQELERQIPFLTADECDQIIRSIKVND